MSRSHVRKACLPRCPEQPVNYERNSAVIPCCRGRSIRPAGDGSVFPEEHDLFLIRGQTGQDKLTHVGSVLETLPVVPSASPSVLPATPRADPIVSATGPRRGVATKDSVSGSRGGFRRSPSGGYSPNITTWNQAKQANVCRTKRYQFSKGRIARNNSRACCHLE